MRYWNSDGVFTEGEELTPGQWNELWFDLRNVFHQNHDDPGVGREVYNLHVHVNALEAGDPDVVFLWDHLFVTNEAFTPYYYHHDYLGSTRLITDKDGTVVWGREL